MPGGRRRPDPFVCLIRYPGPTVSVPGIRMEETAVMSITVHEITSSELAEYESVSIAYEVQTILQYLGVVHVCGESDPLRHPTLRVLDVLLDLACLRAQRGGGFRDVHSAAPTNAYD